MKRAPQEPVAIPGHLGHGSSYVYRAYECRCELCLEWFRSYHRNRDQALRAGLWKPRKRGPVSWYVCCDDWGVTYGQHEYEHDLCIRCGAEEATEEFWEKKWKS